MDRDRQAERQIHRHRETDGQREIRADRRRHVDICQTANRQTDSQATHRQTEGRTNGHNCFCIQLHRTISSLFILFIGFQHKTFSCISRLSKVIVQDQAACLWALPSVLCSFGNEGPGIPRHILVSDTLMCVAN